MHSIHKEILKSGDLIVLVVNLLEIAKNDYGELNYWLSFLYHSCTLSIPISLLVIGTHDDEILEKTSTIVLKIKEKIKEICFEKKINFNFDPEKDILIVNYSFFSVSNSIQNISDAIESHYIYYKKFTEKHKRVMNEIENYLLVYQSPLILVDHHIKENSLVETDFKSILRDLNSMSKTVFLGEIEKKSNPLTHIAFFDFHFFASILEIIKKAFCKSQVIISFVF